MLIAYVDVLYCFEVCIMLCVSFIREQTHNKITGKVISLCRMYTRGQPRTVEAQAKSED